MADNNMAVRGSQYLGDKWDLFKSMMPKYLVEHINGNAMYNLKHPWTKAVYDAFHSMDGGSMMEEMAFDVAFAMVTMDAMSGNTSQFAACLGSCRRQQPDLQLGFHAGGQTTPTPF